MHFSKVVENKKKYSIKMKKENQIQNLDFMATPASVGLFASAAGVVTVRKANQVGIIKRKRRSIISDVTRVSRTFFTSKQMIKTTFCMVSFSLLLPKGPVILEIRKIFNFLTI